MRPSKWLVFIRPSLAGFDRPLTLGPTVHSGVAIYEFLHKPNDVLRRDECLNFDLVDQAQASEAGVGTSPRQSAQVFRIIVRSMLYKRCSLYKHMESQPFRPAAIILRKITF
jgi:hypothetical protein